MGKMADETKGKAKARRKNLQPSRAPDYTVPQTEKPPVAELAITAPTTIAVTAAIPPKNTEAAPTPSGGVPTAVQTFPNPPTQIPTPTPSMLAANLDPLHMLKELAISFSAVGDPAALFARLAEEFHKEKAEMSLTPLEVPPQTLTETTSLQHQQKALLPPTEIPKSLPSTQPAETLINPQESEMEGGESKSDGAEDSDNRGTGEGSEETKEGETEESAEGEKKEETEKEEVEGSDESHSVEDNSDMEDYAAEVDALLEEGTEEDVVVVDESTTVGDRTVRMSLRLARRLSEITATEGGEEQPPTVKGTGDNAPVTEGMTEAWDETLAPEETAEEERRASAERKSSPPLLCQRKKLHHHHHERRRRLPIPKKSSGSAPRRRPRNLAPKGARNRIDTPPPPVNK